MKYKQGDKVVIKPWGLMKEEYGLDYAGNIDTGTSFLQTMETKLKGTDRVVVIRECRDGTGDYFTEPTLNYSIPEECILGYAFEWGEEIEVSDDGNIWMPKVFVGYLPGNQCGPACACDKVYEKGCLCVNSRKFARPIRKPEIEITVKINGKESTLKDISEETLLKIREAE